MEFKLDKNHLIVPKGYNKTKAKEVCNGMGPKGWGWLVPDHFFGLDMTECGNRHDWCYYIGGNRFDKLIADLMFLYNMIVTIWNANNNWLAVPRFWMAFRYFTAVFLGGKSSFNWRDKNVDKN